MKKNILKFILILSIFIMCLSCTKEISAFSNKNNMRILENNNLRRIAEYEDEYVSSDLYLISELYSYIGRISPKTTIAQFKMNFNIEKEKIHVYKNSEQEAEVINGYITTNMIVRFDGIEKDYTLSVVGDINGDNLVNQIDIQSLIKYLVDPDNYNITGIPLISADVNNNGEVNQIDLTALINYVVFSKLDIGEVIKPTKPTIEVVGGENSEDGPYTTKVVVKISPTQTEKVLKTTYTISGTMQVEETEIPEDGLIKLSDDGIYNIKAYTYLEDGSRSSAEELTVNKSENSISDEKIGLIMKLEDKNGEDYQENTWTNKSVWIEPIDTEEEFEGGVKAQISTTYTITGKMSVAIPSNTPILLRESGEYTITTLSVDTIGRTRVKEYKVKIDKDMPTSSTVTFEDEKTEGYYNKILNGTVTHGTDELSQIEKVTYELSGAQTKEETDIENQGTITIEEDGKTIITIRTYDVAGNVKTDTEEILLDKTAPAEITLKADNITSTSFDLSATATDNYSGIQRYEFYIDEELLGTYTYTSNSANISAYKQTSKEHDVKVKVIDYAGNVGECSIKVNMLRLNTSDISHIEFIVDRFTKKGSSNDNVITDTDFIISTTTLSNEAKYIQVQTQQNGEVAEVVGHIKLVRQDGSTVEDLAYFPEDLVISIGMYCNGSGSEWKHSSIVNMLNSTLSGQEESAQSSKDSTIAITNKTNTDNTFSLKDTKILGTKTYTQLIIKDVKIGEEKIEFQIIDSRA